jgi:hypothetical protein
MDIDSILAQIRADLHLEAETEYELLAEIRSHLEEAAAEARRQGMDEEEALTRAASRFGVDEVARELQETHQGWGTLDGIAAAALPVLCALTLRWMVYAPDGTYVGWEQMLGRPGFWIVAVMALLTPLWRFPRRRYALISWAIFWGLSVVVILGEAVQR